MSRLLETGAGSLGWWRVRGSKLADVPTSTRLHDAYRLHTLQADLYQRPTAEILRRCRACGVAPLLAKGWAVARLYPEAGLRPYGDVDLFVRPEQHEAAMLALADFRSPHLTVDLHCGFPDLGDRPLEDVFAHSEALQWDAVAVRTPRPEDRLRHLSVHLLRHGAWRPLWLCDIAASLESIDAHFDWDYCLSGSRQRTQAVVCAAGLAHHLLDARIDHTPLADGARRLPPWLVSSVLRQWGTPYERFTDAPMADALRHASDIVPALRRRWPNAVESTMSMNAPFNRAPRLPVQLADCAIRLGRWLSHSYRA
jgi:hypothetical protein